MRHKIFYLLLGLCAILTSCVQEEMESLGTIKSTVEPVLILPEQAILKVNTQAIKADGKVVITSAYAVPYDEEMKDVYDEDWNWHGNYVPSDVTYTDDYNTGVIHFRSGSNFGLKPGEKYKVILRGYILNKDAKPDKNGYYNDVWGEKNIIDSELIYKVPDFSFTTPKDMYEAFGIDGNNLFDVRSEVLQVLPTSALLDVRISANPGSNMKFCENWDGNSFSEDYHGLLSVKCYLDPDLINEDVDVYDHSVVNAIALDHLKPDTDYYVIIESDYSFYMVYAPEQFGRDIEFKFEDAVRFNKEPIKLHTPKDMYDAVGVDGENIFDVKSEILFNTPTSVFMDLQVSANPAFNMKFYDYSDVSDTYSGNIRLYIYVDSEMTKLWDYPLWFDRCGKINVTGLEPDTDYYVVVASGNSFDMVYDSDNYDNKITFDFEDGFNFNKEPIKLHTAKQWIDEGLIDANIEDILDVKYNLIDVSITDAVIGIDVSVKSGYDFVLLNQESTDFVIYCYSDEQLTDLVSTRGCQNGQSTWLLGLKPGNTYYCVLKTPSYGFYLYKEGNDGTVYRYKVEQEKFITKPVFKFTTPSK